LESVHRDSALDYAVGRSASRSGSVLLRPAERGNAHPCLPVTSTHPPPASSRPCAGQPDAAYGHTCKASVHVVAVVDVPWLGVAAVTSLAGRRPRLHARSTSSPDSGSRRDAAEAVNNQRVLSAVRVPALESTESIRQKHCGSSVQRVGAGDETDFWYANAQTRGKECRCRRCGLLSIRTVALYEHIRSCQHRQEPRFSAHQQGGAGVQGNDGDSRYGAVLLNARITSQHCV
jgi:hypothetical protein